MQIIVDFEYLIDRNSRSNLYVLFIDLCSSIISLKSKKKKQKNKKNKQKKPKKTRVVGQFIELQICIEGFLSNK